MCERHGSQPGVSVSARFHQAMRVDAPLHRSQIVRLTVVDDERVTHHHVDVEVIRSAGLEAQGGELLTLRDRDRTRKVLHDRLAIRRVFDAMKGHWVCGACLRAAVDSASADIPLPP